jgi:hypothetical protein
MAVMSGVVMSNVETFHRDIAALLRSDPRGSATPLASKPGGHRLGAASIYVELVFRQREDAVKASCPILKRAWEGIHRSFRDLVYEYCNVHPPQHVDPNRIAEHLSEYLVRKREGDAAQPAYLEEIADFEWLKYKVMLPDLGEAAGLDHTLFIRQYRYDMLSLPRAEQPWKAPPPEASTLIVCRNRRTGRRMEFTATPFDVMAIARREGMEVGDDVRIEQADALLVAGGVLS